MTTQTLYNQFLKEEITKDQFMYQIRRDERLSQWITPHLSFDDSIKILKNKGVINENTDINKHLEKSGLTSVEKSEVTKKIKDMGLIGDSEIKKAIDGFINTKVKTNLSKGFVNENHNNPKITSAIAAIVKYATLPPQIDYTLPWAQKADKAEKYLLSLPDGEKYLEQARKEIDKHYESNEDGYSAADYNSLMENNSEDELYNLILRYVKDPDDAEAELDKFMMNGIDGVSDYLAFNLERDEDFLRSKYNDLNEVLFEAKKKANKKSKLKPAKLTPDQVNPEELRAGIRIEMEHTDDPETAQTIALQHLEEDPNYYTHLKAMEGEYDKKKIKDKKKNRTDLMSLLDDKMKNVIDKENGMKYVSDKDEKTNVKDTLGNKEAKKGMPKKVKEMPVKPTRSKGVKFMGMPSAGKKIKLSESLDIQLRADAINSFAKLVKSSTPDEIAHTFEINRDFPKDSDIKVSEMIYILKKYGKYKEVMALIDAEDVDPAGGRGLSSHLEESLDQVYYEDDNSSDLEQLETLLKNHDWYFDFSDDHSIYKRGRGESIKIKSLVDKLGEKGKELYNTYAYKNKQFGLEEALDTEEDTDKMASTTEKAPEDKELKTGSETGKPTYPSGEKKYGKVPIDFKLKMTNKLIQSYFDNPEKIFPIQKELAWYLNKFEAAKKKGVNVGGKDITPIIDEYKKAIEFIKAQSSKKPIKENNSLKYSEELANEYGTQEYILKNSIDFEEDEDGGWSIEFNMLIPFEDVPEFDYPEEASRYFKKQYNINNYSSPGAPYSKGGVYETNKTNNGWLLQLQFEGGYDI